MANTKISGASVIAAASGHIIPIYSGTPDEAPQAVTAGGIAALASGGGMTLQLPIIDARYYSCPYLLSVDNASDFDATAWVDYIVAIPVIFGETKTWTEIAVDAGASGVGDAARLGIYSDANGLPDALVLDAGEVTLSSTGLRAKAISQSLTANTWYWLAANLNASSAMLRGGANSEPANHLAAFIMGRSASATPFLMAWGEHTYGALPATFPVDDVTNDNPLYITLRTGV